jgi:hypothetical protein
MTYSISPILKSFRGTSWYTLKNGEQKTPQPPPHFTQTAITHSCVPRVLLPLSMAFEAFPVGVQVNSEIAQPVYYVCLA